MNRDAGMPGDDLCPCTDGSRDCGAFFLDVVGRYSRKNLAIHWEPAPYQPAEPVARQISKAWTQHARSRRSGVLFDGPLCRLIDFSAAKRRLTLTLGPTSFKSFVGTNLTQSNLRYMHGPESLANPLGVSAAVSTADGFLVLGRRSDKVVHHAGRIHPIGGMVEPGDPPETVDPFASIFQELASEAAIAESDIESALCLGLVREKPIVQPELVFDVKLNIDAQTFRRAALKAADAHEHLEWIILSDQPSSVVMFMQQHLASLTPVAVAILLLHGQEHWGSGWFTSARGYLQSLI